MSNFIRFKSAVREQLAKMSEGELFRTAAGKDEQWDTYLGSFKAGTNPVLHERTEHDCQCCKQFIRAGGNAVAVVNNELVSMWDIDVGGDYQVVADALSASVKSHPVVDVFLHHEKNLGTDYNHQHLEHSGETIKWNHFHFELPSKFVQYNGDSIASTMSEKRSGKEVFKRALDEISVEAIETVLELIEQKSIYRGDENKSRVESFLKQKQEYMQLIRGHQDTYCWVKSVEIGGAARVRNTAIGTLLVDIADGHELDAAVRSFETKVAPANYKRPSAVISKRMIAEAQKKVEELGIGDALQRRYAITDDITINNVLFADRSIKRLMNVFEEIAAEVPDNVSNLKKVDAVDINTFIETILPKADSIELMLENRHSSNLMSLIAPVNAEAKPILKWGNNFSWAYNGEVTDSIKERVKRAGGNVEGVLRCSLSWFNYDDLDIHVVEPGGEHIFFGHDRSMMSGARLDVDMNASGRNTRDAVENIIWTDKTRMSEGVYKVFVNNYTLRETVDVGFDVEIEFDGTTHTFHYDKKVPSGGDVQVATFRYSKDNGITFIESLQSTQASKEVWNIATHKFHKVSMVMSSPNHWDDNEIGNKHIFFILAGCQNENAARGFFNEFLSNDLHAYRKVFEVLGSKMKTAVSDNQLSGLGFSSTQRNHVLCKVTGSFTRTIKITF